LIEKAERAAEDGSNERVRGKIEAGDGLDLDDFLSQLQSVRKMGSLKSLAEMIPGMAGRIPAGAEVDEKRLAHVEAIVRSMTRQERRNYRLIDPSRKRRIAKGAGRPLSEVNELLRQFTTMRKMMKKLGGAAAGRRGPFGRIPRGFSPRG